MQTRPLEDDHKAITKRTIAWCAATVLIFAIATLAVFIGPFGLPVLVSKNQLDAVRVACQIIGGIVAIFAMLLAARTLRAKELELLQKKREHKLQERIADDTKHNALEQRITDLYSAASEQIGSEKPLVRHAGLYTLERIAQQHENHRQPVVNLICAYLRSPYVPSDAEYDSATKDSSAAAVQCQELNFRTTAQRILLSHLDPRKPDMYWASMDLDLRGAFLWGFIFEGLTVQNADFRWATFAEESEFVDSNFLGSFDLSDSRGDVNLEGVNFWGFCVLDGKHLVRSHDIKCHGGIAAAGDCSRLTKNDKIYVKVDPNTCATPNFDYVKCEDVDSPSRAADEEWKYLVLVTT